MVNSVVLVGRLTRDPELRKTSSGMSVASFTIAVDDSRKGPNGEKVTIFMPVAVWGNMADTVVKFTRKGSLVGVVGRLTQRKYVDRNGSNVTSTEVSANQVEFLESKNARGQDDQGFAPDQPAPGPTNQAKAKEESKNLEAIDIVDDDLPF